MSEEELISILRDLVQFNTENPPGKTEEIVNYLTNKVFREELGFRNEIISYYKGENQLHDLITKIGIGEKKIILCGHFDVVPSGDPSQWKYHPFSAQEDNGFLYGRGSADMKGGIVMCIAIMNQLIKNQKFLEKYTIIFAGTADEEAGMTGSSQLMKMGIVKDATLLIVAEPTNLNIGIAEKGVLWLKATLKGKAAHGSMPEKGINSIECAATLISLIKECFDDVTNPILGKSTLNIGKIHGGNAINVVPESTSLFLDFRLVPEQDPQKLLDKIRNMLTDPCQLEVEILDRLFAKQSNPDELIIVNLQKEIGTTIIGLSYATDAAKLVTKEDPIPFIIFGPGNPEEIHKFNERVNINHIFKAARALTAALIKTYL